MEERGVKKLEKKGLIAYEKRNIVVKDMAKLREESLIYVDEKPLPYSF